MAVLILSSEAWLPHTIWFVEYAQTMQPAMWRANDLGPSASSMNYPARYLHNIPMSLGGWRASRGYHNTPSHEIIFGTRNDHVGARRICPSPTGFEHELDRLLDG